MKNTRHLLALGLALALFGCATTGPNAARDIEGSYVRVDKPEISLVIKDGRFLQGTTAIHAEGPYKASKLSADKYELRIVYTGELDGARDRVIVRKEGDFVYVQDDGEGPETKFKKQ